MARPGLRSGNLNFQVPDRTNYDRAAKRRRYQHYEKHACDSSNPPGGGDCSCRGPPPDSFTHRTRRISTADSRSPQSLENKLAELEEANRAAYAELKKMKRETGQWKKAAKAIASVVYGGVEISSKRPELEYLVLDYSNRASRRMSLGKMRKALDDCKIAAQLDPSFLKAFLTAGNCHLILGELNDAIDNYKKCLDSEVVCLDRSITIEASGSMQNAEKVACHINQAAELLQQKTSESTTIALVVIKEALSISCYSEKLLEMKGEALFMKYGEVVQMCEETILFAEKNCAKQKQSLKFWRWRLMSLSYFLMAKFDMAFVFLEKYEQLAPADTKYEGPITLSIATISILFRSKSAGNEAYKAGRHREAVEHYSNAVQTSIESRTFAAICLCNRAAAHQALGEIVDAISDCNLAIALDGSYFKAFFRRASLHEKIRDYEHAALDLQRLITLLEEQKEDKYLEDLTIARQSLSSLSTKLKKGTNLDHYLILGLKGSESGSEIKKGYHKAALRHHPDKAGMFLTRHRTGLDGDVWKEIHETIHKYADKLFKMIGEAYTVLSGAKKV